jgi:hypothetical protein
MIDWFNSIDVGILLMAGFLIGAVIGHIDACIIYKQVFGYWPKDKHKHGKKDFIN